MASSKIKQENFFAAIGVLQEEAKAAHNAAVEGILEFNNTKRQVEDLLSIIGYNKERDNVLIVGHSNTIPTFVNELIREKAYPDIEDSNNSNLYIVNICGDQVNHQLIKHFLFYKFCMHIPIQKFSAFK